MSCCCWCKSTDYCPVGSPYEFNWKTAVRHWWMTTWIAPVTLKWCHVRDTISQRPAKSFYGSSPLIQAFVSCEFCSNNKAVIWILDPGSGTGLGYVRPSQDLTIQCTGGRGVCVGWLDQLIPWESVVSLDHLGSSPGRDIATLSHQADDSALRALHTVLVLAVIASMHRPYPWFIYSLSDNNKCLLSAIANYIFIRLLTS